MSFFVCHFIHFFLFRLWLSPLEGAGDVGVLDDVLALGEGVPETSEEGARLVVVVLADDGLDGLGGFLCEVEGDTTG